jgi:hypothetical protein
MPQKPLTPEIEQVTVVAATSLVPKCWDDRNAADGGLFWEAINDCFSYAPGLLSRALVRPAEFADAIRKVAPRGTRRNQVIRFLKECGKPQDDGRASNIFIDIEG